MTEAARVPAIVIGAGVVGCAVAQRLVQADLPPWVIEAGPRIAEGVTARNSGVVHSGIYYPPESLKARSCARGQALLYEWCERYRVPHRKTGKWIVAPRDSIETLWATYENARASGARGLRWVDSRKEVQSALSAIQAEVAIYCSESGIVDPFEYSRSFRVVAEAGGTEFIFDAPVSRIECLTGGVWRVETARGTVEAPILVNAAGLYADELARIAGVDRYRVYPWRGDYFRLRSPHRFDTLIYPVKSKGAAGLGVHLTLALDGSYRLGPDVRLAASKEDFGVPSDLEERKHAFHEAASRYLRGVAVDQLEYDSCGIRPKLRSPTDEEDKDFVLSMDRPGLVNLVGIESPGLTAAIDLADRVVSLLMKKP